MPVSAATRHRRLGAPGVDDDDLGSSLVLVGYTAVFWALGSHPLREAFITSGSSLLTLGFASVHDLPSTICAFTEAVFGLILLALLITYLPSMYSAFSRREVQVALVTTFAGSPPWAVEMLERFHRIRGLDRMEEQVWEPWTIWFVELEETHTSLSALPFFRSPQPDRSWVTAAGVVLDGASLYSSTLDCPRSPPAELCVRTGYLALRTIADFFAIPYDPEPAPDGPISVDPGPLRPLVVGPFGGPAVPSTHAPKAAVRFAGGCRSGRPMASEEDGGRGA